MTVLKLGENPTHNELVQACGAQVFALSNDDLELIGGAIDRWLHREASNNMQISSVDVERITAKVEQVFIGTQKLKFAILAGRLALIAFG